MKVQVDEAVSQALRNASDPVHLVDPNGEVVGTVQPFERLSQLHEVLESLDPSDRVLSTEEAIRLAEASEAA